MRGDSDPNRADDPQYIVRLVKRIVTVSVQTVQILSTLPTLDLTPDAEDAPPLDTNAAEA